MGSWSQNLEYNNKVFNAKENRLNSLKDAHTGKVGIIVGAGPSLDKNVHLLHEATDKVIIISTDGACPTLIARGIDPHYVVSAEEHGVIKMFLRGLNFRRTTGLFSSTIHPMFTDEWTEYGLPCLFYNNRGERLKGRYQKHPRNNPDWDLNMAFVDPIVPNVSFHSIHIARYLGIQSIALMGVDLGVPIGSYHHAKDFPEDCRAPCWRDEKHMVEKMRWGFQRDADLAKQMDSKDISNCTEGGILTAFFRTTLAAWMKHHDCRNPQAAAN